MGWRCGEWARWSLPLPPLLHRSSGASVTILSHSCYSNPVLCFSSLWWEWVGDMGWSEALNRVHQPHQLLS